MQAMAEKGLMMALFNLGGGEIILILALALILLGAKKLPELNRGLGQGLSLFRKATRHVADAIDGEASEAGRSVGGIYGKPATQALRPDNQVAEVYDPDVFEDDARSRRIRNGVRRLFKRLWCWVVRLLERFVG
jgi:sec-independent protein translocase protein TatA